MFSRRRILMKMLSVNTNTSTLIDYFNSYKIGNEIDYEDFDVQWVGCRMMFKRETDLSRDCTFSIANIKKDHSILDSIPTQTAMGYDQSKSYNLRIKVLNKSVLYEGELKENGSIKFSFKGPNYYAESQSLFLEEIQKGVEFIIPISSGEILNNLLINYSAVNEDSSIFTLLFEFYFEEITE